MSLALSKRKTSEIKIRLVPAFSVEANQKNVTTGNPPTTHVFDSIPTKHPSRFRESYLRSDFPIQLEFLPGCQKLAWKVEIERLDFSYYLPLFFDGISEIIFPFDYLARQSVHDMLQHGGAKITPVIGQLIVPITRALRSKQPPVMASMLKALQELANCHPSVGPALVPYYRQILPVCALFKNRNLNIGDYIEYRQRKRMNIGDLIEETLEVFEKTGGQHAFINIKYMVPTYESAHFN